MKKSMAVASASALGVGMVAFGAVPGAAADDVTTPCTSVDDHDPSENEFFDNWLMDCVPQFGMGKAEFTVTSDYSLPDDFLPLDDPGVTVTYSGDATAAADYFGVSGQPAGWWNLTLDSPPGSDPLHYLANPIVPVSGVGAAELGDLPASCETDSNSYTHIYRADYEETSWVFEQTAGGFDWSVTVTLPATTVFLAFTRDTNNSFNIPLLGTPVCLTNGVRTALGTWGDDFMLDTLVSWFDWGPETESALTPLPLAESESQADMGEFPLLRSGGLAGTGAEISPLMIGVGVTAFLAGTALFVVSRVQRRRRDTT